MDRLGTLSRHYHNACLHNVKLREALAQIVEHPENAKTLAQEALNGPLPPPPLAHFYDIGLHTGHPFEEYLELPMRSSDSFAPCEKCGATTAQACIANAKSL